MTDPTPAISWLGSVRDLIAARRVARAQRTVDTVIGWTPYTAQAICAECGTRFHAAGADPRVALAEVVELHDRECEDLQGAARLLAEAKAARPIECFLEDVIDEKHRRAYARAIWAEMKATLLPPP